MDERTLIHGDIQIGTRVEGGILDATCNGESILVKDAANRKNGSLRNSIPNGTDLQREYATYLFAKMVPGLVEVPAMALRDVNGTTYLAMEKVTGGWHGGWGMPNGISLTVKRNMALFDAIVGNTDRHGHNYFIKYNQKGERRIIAIDHGLCFPIPQAGYIDCGSSDFLRQEALPQWCVRWLNKVLSMESQVRRTLAPHLEPEAIDGLFDRVHWMLNRGTFMNLRRFMYYAGRP